MSRIRTSRRATYDHASSHTLSSSALLSRILCACSWKAVAIVAAEPSSIRNATMYRSALPSTELQQPAWRNAAQASAHLAREARALLTESLLAAFSACRKPKWALLSAGATLTGDNLGDETTHRRVDRGAYDIEDERQRHVSSEVREIVACRGAAAARVAARINRERRGVLRVALVCPHTHALGIGHVDRINLGIANGS
eukprot:scaffold160274_cov28-Tisochrysis_lutea.AAC.6